MSPVDVAILPSLTGAIRKQPVVLFGDGDDGIAERKRHLRQREEDGAHQEIIECESAS